jgi:hypothetical protein
MRSPDDGGGFTFARAAAVHALLTNADLLGVKAAPGFHRILDEKLQAFAPEPTRQRSSTAGLHSSSRIWVTDPWNTPPAARVSTVVGAYASFSSKTARPAGGSPAASRQAPTDTPNGSAPRRLSITTRVERDALACLRRLGADQLRPDLADVELKHAFRELARRYHPDRHPGLTGEERARLGALFAEAACAYRTLMATARA